LIGGRELFFRLYGDGQLAAIVNMDMGYAKYSAGINAYGRAAMNTARA
jgi:hypothetical protein